MTVRILVGDCLELMPTLAPASVDAIVSDPPYGLGFMGKAWDHGVPGEPFWRAALAAAKPGAYLVAFGGTRTYHRLTAAIEDAGWEIRDCLSWLYGSGFPKSHDVSKALDKAAGHWRGRAGAVKIESQPAKGTEYERTEKGDAITPAAAACGWGTALKPAWEPIILARKPLSGTVAANWMEHGTGALNIDACRVKFASQGDQAAAAAAAQRAGRDQNEGRTAYGRFENGEASLAPYLSQMDKGRWPANVVLDEEAAAELDAQSGESRSTIGRPRGAASGLGWGMTSTGAEYDDFGGASRFFYTGKAQRAEREAGLREAGLREAGLREAGLREAVTNCDTPPGTQGATNPRAGAGRSGLVRNNHPTVKPLDLMQWLCRLVTPKGGLILDPFCGSGTTGRAAIAEGFRFIGIELDPDYAEIAKARIVEYAPLFTEVKEA